MKKLLTFIHILIIILAYISPFIFSWKIVLAGVIAFYIQKFLIGGCILTKKEFGNFEDNYYYFALKKLGFDPDKKRLRFILDYVVPVSILSLSLFIKVIEFR